MSNLNFNESSLPSGWGMLLDAWKRGEDFRPLMAHLNWDVPVLVLGEQGSSQNVSLAHPLTHAIRVKPLGFSQALVEALVDHPWSPKDFLQHQDDSRQSLPALDDFYAWKIIDAVVENRAFKAMQLIAANLAQSVNKLEYSSIATHKLSSLIVSKLRRPDVCTAIGILAPHFRAQPELVSPAFYAFSEACSIGRDRVALDLLQAFPEDIRILVKDVVGLAGHNKFEMAKVLLDKMDFSRGKPNKAIDSTYSDQNLMLALRYAMFEVHKASQIGSPSMKQEALAREAGDFAVALLTKFRYPINDDLKTGMDNHVMALALEHLPHCFPEVAKGTLVKRRVLIEWLKFGSGSSLSRSLKYYSKMAGEDSFKDLLVKAIDEIAGGLNVLNPRNTNSQAKEERLKNLYDTLKRLASVSGVPIKSLARDYVPSVLLHATSGSCWNLVVAKSLAAEMDSSLEATSVSSRRPRM